MKSSEKILTVLAAAILLFSASLAAFARPKQPKGSQEFSAARLAAHVEGAIARIAMDLTEDDRLRIANVRSVEIDDVGRTMLRVRAGGDFNTDPVLIISASLEFGEDGGVVVAGIDAINAFGDTVTLVLRPANSVNVAADADCRMRIPLPSGTPYCSGECTVSAPDCNWAIHDGDLICKCLPLPQ